MQQLQIQLDWNACRRVYLVWAVIISTGFIATHFHQLPDINYLWVVLSLVGLGYMSFLLMKMRFRDVRLLYIGLLWLLTIAFGLAVSFIAFAYQPLAELIAYLGSFWLFLLGIAHVFNGAVDRSRTYLFTGGIQILAGAVCFLYEPLRTLQYMVAGLVGGLAMLWLTRFR